MSKPRLRPLEQKEEAELDRYLIHAIELVPTAEGLQEDGFLVVASHIMIDAIRAGDPLPAGVSLDDLACWIGTLWGEELCRMAKWNWSYAEVEGGFSGVAVIEPQHTRICFPFYCVHNWLKKSSTNACMHLFTRMCRKANPPLPANSLLVMG